MFNGLWKKLTGRAGVKDFVSDKIMEELAEALRYKILEIEDLKDRLRVEKAMVHMHELAEQKALDERNALRGQLAIEKLGNTARQGVIDELAERDCECPPDWAVSDPGCLVCRAAVLSPQWAKKTNAMLDQILADANTKEETPQ